MALDTLTILNDALRNTGNHELTVINDGTDEWIVASGAYQRALTDLITQHRWNFARATADLVRMGDSDSQTYDDAYALPADALHLLAVYSGGYLTSRYEVAGRTVSLDATTGVTVEYIAAPLDADWHPQAAEVLTMMVEAGILRGLNEDFTEAARRDKAIEDKLRLVRPLVDQQNPARNTYLSGIGMARRTRRG